jgi:NitT/TauT family transport system permease protein
MKTCFGGKKTGRRRLRQGVLISLLAVSVLLGLWVLAAVLVDAVIILPPPQQVAAALLRLAGSWDFWRSVGTTFLRGISGFLISLLTGLAVGVAAGVSLPVHALFKPLIAVIRATPVLSVVLIALLWFKTGTVPVFSSFLIAFPVITQNIIIGIRQTDKNLLEMGRIYGLSAPRRILLISIPSVVPYLVSGAQTALGLTWKVVVAAEVLSIPAFGVGSRMQLAQMSLETAEVFAWTAVAVILSGLSQWFFSMITGRMPWSTRYADSV